MNYLFIAGQILTMLDFIYHPKFEKEIAALKRRFCNIKEGLISFQRLCEVQFHPANPQRVIAPAKLHRITQNDIWGLWKIELVIPKSGLRPNQFPRIWFCVQGAKIGFLCIATHIKNYNDNDMNRQALERLNDIF